MAETTETMGRRRRVIRLVLATFAALTVIVPVTASRADAGFRRGEQTAGTQTPCSPVRRRVAAPRWGRRGSRGTPKRRTSW